MTQASQAMIQHNRLLLVLSAAAIMFVLTFIEVTLVNSIDAHGMKFCVVASVGTAVISGLLLYYAQLRTAVVYLVWLCGLYVCAAFMIFVSALMKKLRYVVDGEIYFQDDRIYPAGHGWIIEGTAYMAVAIMVAATASFVLVAGFDKVRRRART